MEIPKRYLLVVRMVAIGIIVLAISSCLPQEESESEPLLDPDSAENNFRLEDIENSVIKRRCVNFVEEIGTVHTGISRDGSFDITMYTLDNYGQIRSSTNEQWTRRVFGAHNILIECNHDKFGKMQFFHPALGEVDGGLWSDYELPLWTGLPSWHHTQTIAISPATSVVYQVFQALLNKQILEEGYSDLEIVKKLYKMSIELTSEIDGLRPPNIDEIGANSLKEVEFTNDYLGYRRGSTQNDRDWDYFVTTITDGIITERFRTILEFNASFNNSIELITQEIGSQLVNGTRSEDYGDLIAAGFIHATVEPISVNADFSSFVEGWSTYEFNATNNEKELSFSETSGEVQLSLEHVTNRDTNQLPQEYGLLQDVNLDSENINSIYLKASYKRMSGTLEEDFFIIQDSSGAATISVELFDVNDQKLGSVHLVHTQDPLFSDTFFHNTPQSLNTSTGNTVYRLPNIGNAGLIVNLKQAVSYSLSQSEIDRIHKAKLYIVAGDYIAGRDLRHWTGSLLARANCRDCRGLLIVDEVGLYRLK